MYKNSTCIVCQKGSQRWMEYILCICSCCKEHYDRKSLVLYKNENMSDVLLRCILSYLFELPNFKFWLTCLKNLILVWAIWWTAWQDWAGFLLNNFMAICSDIKNSLLDINKLKLIKEFNIYDSFQYHQYKWMYDMGKYIIKKCRSVFHFCSEGMFLVCYSFLWKV